MNSLEIVNGHIKHWESMINQAYIHNAENGYYDELDIVLFQERLKEYEQIKQDLEILEIIIFLSKNGFNINCLDKDQCKKLHDFLNKIGDNHD